MDPPLFLTLDEVLDLHRESIDRYGGGHGIRDMGLLQSALAMPAAAFGGKFLHPDLPAMGAALLFHLVQNHPFVDGNKRIAFVAMNVFLILNGLEIETPEPDVVATILGVAEGRLDRDGLADWLRRVTIPYRREK